MPITVKELYERARKRLQEAMDDMEILGAYLQGNLDTTSRPVFTVMEGGKNKAYQPAEENMPYLKEGTIRKKPDGRWEARYYRDGKRCYITARTQQDCVKKLNAAIEAKRKGVPLEQKEKTTLGGWLNEWYKLYKEPTLKEGSLVPIEVAIRLHIPEDLKAKELGHVTPLETQKAINGIEADRTRKYVFSVLTQAFRKAMVLKMIKSNPMDGVELAKCDTKQGQALTIPEQEAFCNTINGHKMQRLFLFYLFTGARRSEALSLQWSDIDWEKEEIHIPGTKTKTSDRIIPLFPAVKLLLEPMRGEGKVFPFLADNVTHTFGDICPTHKLHDLRHTFATRCLEAGIPMKVVQLWLGHSKMDTTSNIYTHVQTDFNKKEAEKLNAVFNTRQIAPYFAP